jgi:hypothetical protein
MTWANTNTTYNAALRKHDWNRFISFRDGSERLRDALRAELGMEPFPRRVTQERKPEPDTCDDVTVYASVNPGAMWRDTLRDVADLCGVDVEHMTGDCRKPMYVRARGLAAVILKRRGSSYPQIGRWMGGRDHSTIIHAIKKVLATATPRELSIIELLAPVDEAAA